MIIWCKADVLLGMGISRGLDITFSWRIESEMANNNDMRRLVFPLIPNACAYEELAAYFANLEGGGSDFNGKNGVRGRFSCSRSV